MEQNADRDGVSRCHKHLGDLIEMEKRWLPGLTEGGDAGCMNPSVLKNPFTYTPPIRGYLGYAYLLSILFAQENPPWPWLYNQYIAIGARRDYSRFEQIATDWMGVYEGAMQYYFMELPVEQVADPDQGLQAILSLLRRGYYVYGEFNERYVPHTSSYRRRDFRHCYCLYGYSREQHLLLLRRLQTRAAV